jgi:uncharacterized protein YciI
MLILVTLRYRVALEEVERHTADHRTWAKELSERGKLLASGPFVPRSGGLLVLSVDDRAEAEAIVASDPFQAHGIAAYAIEEWSPTIGRDRFGL